MTLLFLVFTINSYGQIDPTENFKKSTVKIGEVRFDICKGTLPVKIIHSDSSSAFISLPVHIIKSSSLSPEEPIYWMAGGPGESNLELTPPKEYLASHDFVLVGYRGVDGPVMKKSKKIMKALRGVNNQLLSDKSLDNLGTIVKQYVAESVKNGIDINYFTIIDVIDDFEEVRKQLGHQKINLYSVSYGTRVALLYSYRYPEAVKRSLMVAVNPPGHCIWYPEMTTRIIRDYDSIYMAQYGAGDISIEESIRHSFERMPKRWSLFKLDADKIKATSFCMLYSKNSAVMAFDAHRKAALKGDYSGLYFMQLAYDYIDLFKPVATNYGDQFIKAYSADYNPEMDYRKVFRPDKLEIDAPLSMLYWGMGSIEAVNLIDAEYRELRLCITETLMVGGDLDIANPPELTINELMPYMSNGKQVILKHMAHTGDLRFSQRSAYKHMFVRYFDDGVVDTSKFKQDSVNFETKRSFNKMAKWLYPLVLIMSIIK